MDGLVRMIKDGTLEIYDSTKEAAEATGVSAKVIRGCIADGHLDAEYCAWWNERDFETRAMSQYIEVYRSKLQAAERMRYGMVPGQGKPIARINAKLDVETFPSLKVASTAAGVKSSTMAGWIKRKNRVRGWIYMLAHDLEQLQQTDGWQQKLLDIINDPVQDLFGMCGKRVVRIAADLSVEIYPSVLDASRAAGVYDGTMSGCWLPHLTTSPDYLWMPYTEYREIRDKDGWEDKLREMHRLYTRPADKRKKSGYKRRSKNYGKFTLQR